MQKSRLDRSHLKLGFKIEQPSVDVESLRACVENNLANKHLSGLKKNQTPILNALKKNQSILNVEGLRAREFAFVDPNSSSCLHSSINLLLLALQVGIEHCLLNMSACKV